MINAGRGVIQMNSPREARAKNKINPVETNERVVARIRQAKNSWTGVEMKTLTEVNVHGSA